MVSRYLNNGEGEQYEVVHTPEFLRQGTAVADFLSPDRVVIGCRTDNSKLKMEGLFSPIKARLVLTDWQSSEMIKYASNVFLAVKISYINTIANLCEKVDADVQDVVYGVINKFGRWAIIPCINMDGDIAKNTILFKPFLQSLGIL